MSVPSILIVEDDPVCARFMSLALSERFSDVRLAASGAAALQAAAERSPALVFLDLHLPDIEGRDLLAPIKQLCPGACVVMVTASDDVSTIVDSVRRGAINYLVKPVSPAAVVTAATNALGAAALPPATSTATVPELIGASEAMVQVRRLVMLAAASDVNVLLAGETGTGKELAARAIHRLSRRRGCPFVPHNCATTTAELFDSEFFGHRRGAFTSADRDHAGLLAQASEGILFLDELASMGLAQQAKLLRVLDDGVVRPVGASQTQVVNVRFVAATNQASRALILAGALREDFYYRLLGFEIVLPPLRDRREDIPALAAHFLGGDVRRLSAGALHAMLDAPWPGNVRQLAKSLASARALAGAEAIEAHHLDGAASGSGGIERVSEDASRTMKDLQRDGIAQALRDAGGNRSRAARSLGIDRSTLRRKLRDSPG